MSPTIITSLCGSILRVGRTYTPPMGTPHGIAELQPVELNGYPQWLLIRGHDVSRPVLLFLHGGPGESNMWTLRLCQLGSARDRQILPTGSSSRDHDH